MRAWHESEQDILVWNKFYCSFVSALFLLMSTVSCQARIYWCQSLDFLCWKRVSLFQMFDGTSDLGEYIYFWSFGHGQVFQCLEDLTFHCGVNVGRMKRLLRFVGGLEFVKIIILIHKEPLESIPCFTRCEIILPHLSRICINDRS